MMERYHRSLRTTAERKANIKFYNKEDKEDNPELYRGKRSHKNLPNAWDDYAVGRKGKGWKAKGRKSQYYVDGRGSRHTYTFNGGSYELWRKIYRLKEYFAAHGISYEVKELRVIYTYIRYQYYKQELCDIVPYYGWRYRAAGDITIRRQMGWQSVYRDVLLDKPIPHKHKLSETIGYKVTWWSKKDIGIERILAAIPA